MLDIVAVLLESCRARRAKKASSRRNFERSPRSRGEPRPDQQGLLRSRLRAAGLRRSGNIIALPRRRADRRGRSDRIGVGRAPAEAATRGSICCRPSRGSQERKSVTATGSAAKSTVCAVAAGDGPGRRRQTRGPSRRGWDRLKYEGVSERQDVVESGGLRGIGVRRSAPSCRGSFCSREPCLPTC